MAEDINKRDQIINDGLLDLGEEIPKDRDKEGGLRQTLSDTMQRYNLNTTTDFIDKVGKLKFSGGKDESVVLQQVPSDLKDAAFLPVNTIAEIALRQDIDMVISQIPEWFTALTVTRDAICESDVVTGKLSRTITFDDDIPGTVKEDNIMKKIEHLEEKYELHSIIKNHCVFNTLEYGEGYAYVIPYAKVFEDLYKYKLNNTGAKNGKNSVSTMFDTSTSLIGLGYGESSSIERSLHDVIISEIETKNAEELKQKKSQKGYVRNTGIYTESGEPCMATEIFNEHEIMTIYPMGEIDSLNEAPIQDNAKKAMLKEAKKKQVSEFDQILNEITKNITYIDSDIALPVIEESAHDLRAVYETKYKKEIEENSKGYVNVDTFFESVMENDEHSDIDAKFRNVKGVYIRILPATKLIPIRIDRVIIGYYYVSDLTRPEVSGQRRNSGLSGYTLRTPSIGYDSFSPDQMFCEKLASKIINNFDLKFMHDNAALYQEIVAILEQHKFNEAMLRFVFIPAENVQQFTINKDGTGRGHSMLEPGLVTARMYMFLKLYSILYQINNSQVRVYYVHMSGIDTNYNRFIQDTIRKFAARRVTANDIFNYRTSMTKVSGGSELIMPMGTGEKPPITFDTIEAAQAPINNELLETLKNEAINATPVPSAMVQGAMSELDFAKEVELANTRFTSMVSSHKLDFNPDITKMYRKIARWDSDIDPKIIETLQFSLQMPIRKTLEVTSEMISNFNSLVEMLVPTFLTKDEQKEAEADKENKGGVVREFKKQLLRKFIPQLDVDSIEELVEKARAEATPNKLKQTNAEDNLLADAANEDEGMM